MPASSNNKAFLTTEDNQRIPCLFNPSDLALTQFNGWAANSMPGKGVPTLRYTGAGSGLLRLTLFFDTTDTGSAVTEYTSKVVGLMALSTSLPGANPSTNNARPPWVVFHWGRLPLVQGGCLRPRADVRILQQHRYTATCARPL